MSSKDIRVSMTETAALPESLLREAEEAGGLLCRDGNVWLIRGECAFSCEDTPEGLVLLGAAAGEDRDPETAEEAVRLLLFSGKRAGEMTRRFRIPAGGPRCVIALRCESRRGQNLTDGIRLVAPLEAEDLLIRYSSGLAVLIKQGEDVEEAAEFAMALVDTMEGETGLRLEAGVSDPAGSAEGWAEAFREAKSAMDTGAEFHLHGPVYVYRKQLLERLLREIPREKGLALRRQIFGAGAERLNGEMMETAEVFLRSDLNLSDTARQMFIHRNTLTYRLDKIRKETGLDLRKFGDALIFRVVMALPAEENAMNENER
ncbi:MAG: helix-turn-helix domain-containing protein [Clostridiales bacterium]|nr:helix-turn-helix domain-containing protein [Clostridiales bacterium]